MSLLILTLGSGKFPGMFRYCSGNAPVPYPSSRTGLFQERSLALFQERSIRAVPGTFLKELVLEQRLLRSLLGRFWRESQGNGL